jgi:hypothetical protein
LRLGLQKCQGQPLELLLPLATLLTEKGDFAGAQELIAPIEAVLPKLTEQDRGTAQLVCGLVRSRVNAERGDLPSAIAALEKTLALPEVQWCGEAIPILAAAAPLRRVVREDRVGGSRGGRLRASRQAATSRDEVAIAGGRGCRQVIWGRPASNTCG